MVFDSSSDLDVWLEQVLFIGHSLGAGALAIGFQIVWTNCVLCFVFERVLDSKL